MAQFFQLTALQRLGSLTLALFIIPVTILPLMVQASPRRSLPVGNACRGAEFFSPDNPDVRSLKSLIDRYQISISDGAGIGNRPITRYEYAIALNQVLSGIRNQMTTGKVMLSDQEIATLLQLANKYGNELNSLQYPPESLVSYFQVIRSLNTKAVDPRNIQTLRELARIYGVNLSRRPLSTQYEFVMALGQLGDRIQNLINSQPNVVSKNDLEKLQQLQKNYTAEITIVRGQLGTSNDRASEAILAAPMPLTTGNRSVSPRGMPPTSAPVIRPRVSQAMPLNAPAPVQGNLQYGGLSPEQRIHKPGTFNTEDYNAIHENIFQRPQNTPLSTFSIDVDTASYSNVRRFLNQGQLPPKDAVRIEEMINYFPYDYPQPEANQPFSITTDVAAAPWNPQHKLVQIGLKGKQLQTLQPSNLVFLVDVSGSMQPANKLPLVKQSLCLLVNELSANDRVTLVVYAGNAGLVLPPTAGDQKAKIMQAIDQLEAGGSTAGGAGIELAYKMAQQSFLKNGNNRVILATDGDFNVGVSSEAELVRMIEQKRDRGIFLTVLGFGMGNYKDSKMEQLADKGNGNYAYIDSLLEAKKVLVNDLRGTLFAIAKDVKIQVEFNPAKVQAYRLVGYENRLLRDQDFNDDTKDAGEVGAGHTVTALYEVIPTGIESDIKLPTVDPLKYQQPDNASTSASDELMQVKLRYKEPNGSTSKLITGVIHDRNVTPESASNNLKFSSAVAMYGMLLRDSEFKGQASLEAVLRLAKQAKGSDQEGYRAEFIQLVEQYRSILAQTKSSENASNGIVRRDGL